MALIKLKDEVRAPDHALGCPICGRHNIVVVETGIDGVPAFWVECSVQSFRGPKAVGRAGCGAIGPRARTLEKAVELWNRRAAVSDTEVVQVRLTRYI
jgi:hypothetical protein